MNSANLISKWQHVIGAHPIPTWTEPASLAYCAEVASHSALMVEIGSFVGVSAKVMLAANPRLHLWCVDVFSAFTFNYEVCAHFLKDEIREGRCELITGDSKKAAEMLAYLGETLDAVWIDGCHATDCVKQDIRYMWPLLRNGCPMFGHDFDVPYNDVAQGVIASLPVNRVNFPVPRVWNINKQPDIKIIADKCCGNK